MEHINFYMIDGCEVCQSAKKVVKSLQSDGYKVHVIDMTDADGFGNIEYAPAWEIVVGDKKALAYGDIPKAAIIGKFKNLKVDN